MKSSSAHAFVNQMLVYTLVMVSFSASAGLGTVWLRHQISETANATRRFELQLAAVERRLAETTTSLAGEQSPDRLEAKNRDLQLGLVRPEDGQIVRVEESPEDRLAARRNIDLFAGEAAAGATVRFSLN